MARHLSTQERVNFAANHGFDWEIDSANVYALIPWSTRQSDGSVLFGEDREEVPTTLQAACDWLGY